MKSRYFLILAVLAALFGLFQLSVNARQVASLRDQVLGSDQSGAATTAGLTAIEQFSHSHMNASVQFELTASYQRAVAATVPPPPSGALYAQAQAACSGKADSIAQAHCVTDYVSKRLPPPTTPSPPPDRSLYVKSFHSPTWAPDLAGLALLGSVVLLAIAILVRLLRPRPRF